MYRLTASYEEGPGYGLDPPLERNNLPLSHLHHHPLQLLLELTRNFFFSFSIHAKLHDYFWKTTSSKSGKNPSLLVSFCFVFFCFCFVGLNPKLGRIVSSKLYTIERTSRIESGSCRYSAPQTLPNYF
jgi:hypothetical protein